MAVKTSVVIGLSIAVVLDTAGQLLWKYAAASMPVTPGFHAFINEVLARPVFLAVACIFLCQLVNWLIVLKKAELSFAQPITALSYITVCTASAFLFGEQIGLAKILGIAFVLTGVWFLSQSHEDAA